MEGDPVTPYIQPYKENWWYRLIEAKLIQEQQSKSHILAKSWKFLPIFNDQRWEIKMKNELDDMFFKILIRHTPILEMHLETIQLWCTHNIKS